MKNIVIKIIRFIEPSRRCVWCGENAVVDIGGEDYCMACSTIQQEGETMAKHYDNCNDDMTEEEIEDCLNDCLEDPDCIIDVSDIFGDDEDDDD